MRGFRVHRTNELVKLLTVCAGSAILGFALAGKKLDTAQAYRGPLLRQSDEKVIVVAEHEDAPLQFGDVLRLNNVKIRMGTKFSSRSIAERGGGHAEDWLEGLEVGYVNKSDKQITYIALELQFPDTMINGPQRVYRELSAGIEPRLGGASTHAEPLAVNPGDMFTFALAGEDLQRIKRFLAAGNFQLTEMNKVRVQVLELIFADGYMWTLGGSYFRPNPNAPHDPNAPHGYERIKPIRQ